MKHSHQGSKKITLHPPPVVGELIAKTDFDYGQDTMKCGPQLMVLEGKEAGITVWMDLLNTLDYFIGSFLPSQDLYRHTHMHRHINTDTDTDTKHIKDQHNFAAEVPYVSH